MRVHVISLERSLARRAALTQRLGDLGVPYELSPAVDGAAGYASFARHDSRQYFLNTGRAASDAEVGCYASHLRLWQLCAATGEPFVVMEDDAAPLPTFAEAFELTRCLVPRYGFVRLEYDGPTRPARTREVERAGRFAVHYFSRYPYGAMCYALAPHVARAFIESSRVLRAPVDQFIKRCWEHGQPLYGLLPYSVREGALAAESTIRARTKQPLAPGLRARRLAHKFDTRVRRIAFNARWSRPALRGRAWLDDLRSSQPDDSTARER